MTGIRLNKLVSILIAAILLIEGIFVSMSPIRVNAVDDYRLWRQWDERWGEIYLGESSDTMARSGCLVTSMAILAVHSGTKDPEEFNPGSFVEELNEVGAFNIWGGIASWAKVTEVIPEIRFVKSGEFYVSDTSGKAQELLTVMQEGYHVVCNVGGHWVYIEGVDGSDVYMIDPAKDDVKMFDAYANENITVWQAYTAKNPPNNVIGPLITATTTSTTTTTTAASATTTITTTTTTTAAETTTAAATTTTETAISTTTTSTTVTTSTTTTISYELGEYYNLGSVAVSVYDSSNGKDVINYLGMGNIVNIIAEENGRGAFELDDNIAWVDIRKLNYASEHNVHDRGDINNDGEINISDLALLNEYLNSLNKLPHGIAILRKCEKEAADINDDGAVNFLDIQKYLSLICS